MNEQIVVNVLGEIWAATSSHTLNLNIGDKIKVVGVNGLILKIEPLAHQSHSQGE